MDKAKDIKEELLKQMDENSDQTSVKTPQEIIARDTHRVRRLKRIVIISWSVVVGCFVTGAFLCAREGALFYGASSDEIWLWTRVLAVALRPFLLIAIILTISLYIRSRTLTLRKIQARLAGIEEYLKKMSQDKSPASGT